VTSTGSIADQYWLKFLSPDEGDLAPQKRRGEGLQ